VKLSERSGVAYDKGAGNLRKYFTEGSRKKRQDAEAPEEAVSGER
jgi:hypothetical protein